MSKLIVMLKGLLTPVTVITNYISTSLLVKNYSFQSGHKSYMNKWKKNTTRHNMHRSKNKINPPKFSTQHIIRPLLIMRTIWLISYKYLWFRMFHKSDLKTKIMHWWSDLITKIMHWWKLKQLGTDVGRTRDLRFTRATPYHLATAPLNDKKDSCQVTENDSSNLNIKKCVRLYWSGYRTPPIHKRYPTTA